MPLSKDEVQAFVDRLCNKDNLTRNDKQTLQQIAVAYEGPTVVNMAPKTRDLVHRWDTARKRTKQAQQALKAAECSEAATSKELREWLMPTDAREDEVFHIWMGDSLLSVSKNGIAIRIEGQSLK